MAIGRPNAKFTIDDLLSLYPPPIRNTVCRLRRIVLEVAPEADEKANAGWRSSSYRSPRMGYFCGIFPFEERVDLIFEFGALLADPEGILEGDARQVRYLRFRGPKEIRVQRVNHFLRAALDLPADHSIRQGLTHWEAVPDQAAPAGRKPGG